MEADWRQLARHGRHKDAVNSYLCSYCCTIAEAEAAVRWFLDELRMKKEGLQ